MIQAGQIVLLQFPQTNQGAATLRPALVVRALPGPHDDWLVSMISSQTRHKLPDFDEIVEEGDPEFSATGLKITSLIRISRLAVVSASVLQGSIGALSDLRLNQIQSRIANWIRGRS